MKTLEPVDLSFFERAPLVIEVRAVIGARPEAVFAAFADAAGWPRWFPLMRRAQWTRGDGGVGSEREVALRLFGRFAERMIAWEPGARYAFTMIGTTAPMATQMAEDYQLTAVAGGTRLDWRMAATPTALGRVATPALRRIMVRLLTRAADRLDRQLRR